MTAILVFVVMVLTSTAVCAQQPGSSCTPMPLPWSTSFEDEGVDLPPCWTVMHSYYDYPFIYRNAYAASGTASLIMSSGGGQDYCMLASPMFAHGADSLHVGFWLTMSDNFGVLQVGLVSDTADTATFTPFLIVDLATATFGYYEFYTDGYTAADTAAVAFRLSAGRLTLDDVEVEASTSCRRPWHPVVVEVTNTSLTLAWSAPGVIATSYLVRSIDTAAHDTVFQTVAALQATLAGLSPATAYDVAVAALCGADTVGWMSAGVLTTDVSCRRPLAFTLEAATSTAAVLAWQHDTSGYVPPSAVTLAVSDMLSPSAPAAAPQVVGNYAFLQGLTTGHRYQATLQAVCQNDTSMPLKLYFTPLAEACATHEGTAASSALVTSGSSRYSYSQMLYPQAILAGMDTVYALALRVAHNTMLFPRRLTFYVAQTADSVLATNIVSPLMTCVADSVMLSAGYEGWLVVPFATPMAVDTTRNLVVAVLDNTGVATGAVSFGVHGEAHGGSLFTTAQSLPLDPSVFDIPMYSLSQVADVQLFGNCAMTQCQPPAAVVTAVADTALTLRWTGGGDTSVVQCLAEGGTASFVATIAGNGYTQHGLIPATRYAVRVGALCPADTAWSAPISATTLCGTVGVPYATDFSAGAHPCWQGSQIETDGGIIVDDMLLAPQVDTNPSALQVRLALHALSDSAVLRVGVFDAATQQATWLDSVVATELVSGQWVAYLDAYTGNGGRIALHADRDWLVQMATIEPLDDCLPPRRLVVSNVGSYGATLSWTATADTFDVYISEEGRDDWTLQRTASSEITFDGLTPRTAYRGYIVSLCAASAQPSAASYFHFTTECGAIRYFPYAQDFESGDATFPCWTVAFDDPACAAANPVVVSTDYAASGRNSLRFSSYNNIQSGRYDQYFISPRIQSADSIFLSFSCYKSNYDAEPFQVGFSTYGNSVDDFLWLDEMEPQPGQWTPCTIGLPASTRYLAIRYMGRGNYYLYIDNIVITGPGCAAPQLTAVDEQADAVGIEWEHNADTAYVAITQGVWLSNVEGSVVAGSNYTFTGLMPAQSYTVGVRYRCPDGLLSDWTLLNVTTIDTLCTPPSALAVDSVGFGDAFLSWNTSADEHLWQLAIYDNEGIVWQSGHLADTVCHITGLAHNRTYAAIVRSYCTDIPGLWSDTLVFTTVECMPVSDMEYERIDFRTVCVTWTDPGDNEILCHIEYGPEGFTVGTGNVLFSASPCRLMNLDPYTDYDVYVRNICQADIYSDSAMMLHVPSDVAVADVDMQQPLLSPNPASDVVSITGLAPAARVMVVDAMGRVVADRCATTSVLTIDVSGFGAGTYFVRVVSGATATVRKLVVR